MIRQLCLFLAALLLLTGCSKTVFNQQSVETNSLERLKAGNRIRIETADGRKIVGRYLRYSETEIFFSVKPNGPYSRFETFLELDKVVRMQKLPPIGQAAGLTILGVAVGVFVISLIVFTITGITLDGPLVQL